MPRTLRRVDTDEETLAELKVLVGFDEDLAAEATRRCPHLTLKASLRCPVRDAQEPRALPDTHHGTRSVHTTLCRLTSNRGHPLAHTCAPPWVTHLSAPQGTYRSPFAAKGSRMP